MCVTVLCYTHCSTMFVAHVTLNPLCTFDVWMQSSKNHKHYCNFLKQQNSFTPKLAYALVLTYLLCFDKCRLLCPGPCRCWSLFHFPLFLQLQSESPVQQYIYILIFSFCQIWLKLLIPISLTSVVTYFSTTSRDHGHFTALIGINPPKRIDSYEE